MRPSVKKGDPIYVVVEEYNCSNENIATHTDVGGLFTDDKDAENYRNFVIGLTGGDIDRVKIKTYYLDSQAGLK